MTPAQLAAITGAGATSVGIGARTNALRAAPIHHRTAVVAPDVIASPALAVLTDVPASGGTLAFSTNYKAAIAAGTILGNTPPGAIGNVTTSVDGLNTHSITIPVAQSAGATLYHIFLSVDAAPKYVAQITEAQRAAGCTVTAMGTVTGASPGAGIVQVQAVGTGVLTSSNPFIQNTAYVTSGITPVNCAGYSKAHVYLTMTPTDLRALASCIALAFEVSQAAPGVYSLLQATTVSPGTTVGQTLLQTIVVSNVDGTSGLIVLFNSILGQGTSIEVWVEME